MNDTRPSTQITRVVQFARLWRTGARCSVEDFLERERLPNPPVEDLLDLIQQEIQLREEALEVPAADEYRERFPSVAEQISALFAVNEILVPRTSEGEEPDLPQYRLEGRLGKGAIGDVFRARDEVLGRPLAVKVLRQEWQNDRGAAERFLQEACTAARLQHPGIAPVYEAGYSEQDRPYIAMKLVEGRTLADLLAERASPATDLDQFVVVFEQVCQTVAYAHSQGVLHRDLKPANIMVGAFGEVQVMDWGLAKGFGDVGAAPHSMQVAGSLDSTSPSSGLTQDGDMIGTPAYAPPEQIRGERERVSAASDVFGLGAILCEILTGRPVFDSVEHGTAANVEPAYARLRESGADRELVAMAIACLAADPKDRPSDGAAVARAVADHRANQRERLRAAELAEARAASEKKARRRAELLRLIGILAVAIAGIGGWAWYSRQSAVVREVTVATDEGESLREENVRLGGDPAILAAADRSARRAEGLLQGVVGNRELRERVHSLLANLEADARDPEMVRRLEQIRLERTGLGRGDLVGLDAAYTETFREHGIDIDASPDEIVGRIRTRPAKAQMIAAIDYWASQSAIDAPNGDRATKLFAIVRQLDPDPWRNQLREALLTRDDSTLVKLTEQAMKAGLPAAMLVTLGTALASRSELTDRGLGLLRVARRKFPDDFWANHNLGYFLCRADPPQCRESIPFFTAAVSLRPNLAGVRVNAGNAHRAIGDLDAAIASHREALAIDPFLPQAHGNLANVLWEQGEIVEAIAHCREVVRIDPAYRGGLARLGEALMQIGSRDEAVEVLGKAAKAEPANIQTLVAYAEALKAPGRFADAKDALERARSLASDRPLQVVRLDLFIAEMEKLLRFERDIAKIEAGAIVLKDPESIWLAAWVSHLLRRDATAVKLVEKALREDPDREHCEHGQDALFHIASAARSSNAQLALKWLQSELDREVKRLNSDDRSEQLAARRTIRIWQQHVDLAALREPASLSRLPDGQRSQLQTFWADADAATKRGIVPK